MNLINFPLEILENIFKNVKIRDIINFSETCKKANKSSKNFYKILNHNIYKIKNIPDSSWSNTFLISGFFKK